MDTRYVFTLIHGTWARMPWRRKTAWIQPDAWFASQLREHLPGGVEVIPFEWGGWNNHASRYRASRRLIDQLKATFDRFPDAKHYLISHSHGGNVALYALNDERLREKIAGLVCMATPFLIARTRDLGGKTSEHVGVLIFVLTVLVYAVLQTFSFWNSWPVLAGTGARLGAILVLVFTLMLLIYASNEIAKTLRAAMAHPSDLKADQLLIIRSPGDEASAALGLFQFVSQLNVRVFLFFSMLNARLERWTDSWPTHKGKLALIAAGGFAVFLIVGGLSVGLWSRFQNWLLLVPAIGIAVAGLLSGYEAAARFLSPSKPPRLGTFVFRVAAGAVLLPVVVVVSVLLVPFGIGFAFASLFLDVTAETTPIGEWTVHQLAPRLAVDANVPLSHSGVYANPDAVSVIHKWIGDQ